MAPALLLGHRGLRSPALAPENTYAAFDLCLAHGCNGFEFDVRRTALGDAVVCHGPRVGSTAVSKASKRQLKDVPRLQDVLDRYKNRVFLDIELKVRGLESQLLTALRGQPPTRDFVVSSFLPDVIYELVARSGIVPVGIICKKQAQLDRWPVLPVDYVIVHQSLVSSNLIENIHAARRKAIVWTVNDAPSMRRMADLEVDGIVSDDTELLVNTLKPALKLAAQASAV
jgi:glycerophosphoryl diester phosphodiesterase